MNSIYFHLLAIVCLGASCSNDIPVTVDAQKAGRYDFDRAWPATLSASDTNLASGCRKDPALGQVEEYWKFDLKAATYYSASQLSYQRLIRIFADTACKNETLRLYQTASTGENRISAGGNLFQLLVRSSGTTASIIDPSYVYEANRQGICGIKSWAAGSTVQIQSCTFNSSTWDARAEKPIQLRINSANSLDVLDFLNGSSSQPYNQIALKSVSESNEQISARWLGLWAGECTKDSSTMSSQETINFSRQGSETLVNLEYAVFRGDKCDATTPYLKVVRRFHATFGQLDYDLNLSRKVDLVQDNYSITISDPNELGWWNNGNSNGVTFVLNQTLTSDATMNLSFGVYGDSRKYPFSRGSTVAIQLGEGLGVETLGGKNLKRMP